MQTQAAAETSNLMTVHRTRCSRSVALALAALLPGAWYSCVRASPRAIAAASPASLAACGRALCTPDGDRFAWRGVTAFALADLLADGREHDARAFVAWASDMGFTVLRVLAMNHGWMDLSPEDGRRVLPRLFALAGEHGMHVQIVALAGTGKDSFSGLTFLRDQVQAVSTLCAAAPNCVLEIANEPYHSSQAKLDDPALMERLQSEVADGVPVTWGAPRHDTPDRLAGGTFVVVHRPRSGDRWDRVSQVRELGALSRRTGKFVVDNEPIGAAEQASTGRREALPQLFFAQGVLSRLFEVGATFHCEDCLLAQVPAPNQQACARAFVSGATIIPADVSFTSDEGPASEAPRADRKPLVAESAGLAFAATSASRGWVVALGQSQGPPDLQAGWRALKQLSEWPDVKVWEIRRDETESR